MSEHSTSQLTLQLFLLASQSPASGLCVVVAMWTGNRAKTQCPIKAAVTCALSGVVSDTHDLEGPWEVVGVLLGLPLPFSGGGEVFSRKQSRM